MEGATRYIVPEDEVIYDMKPKYIDVEAEDVEVIDEAKSINADEFVSEPVEGVEVINDPKLQKDWGEPVNELFHLMKQNSMEREIAKLSEQMKGMSMVDFAIDKIMDEIDSMKQRQNDMEEVFLDLLSDMEERLNKDLSTKLQEVEAARNELEKSYMEIKQDHISLKDAFKKKAASIVQSVKDSGVQALSRVCEFTQLAQGCGKVRDKLLRQSVNAESTIKKVNEADRLFREGIIHLRNANRTMKEKELVSIKEKGLFATRARVKTLDKIKNLTFAAAVSLDNAVKKTEEWSQKAVEVSERQAETKRNKHKR